MKTSDSALANAHVYAAIRHWTEEQPGSYYASIATPCNEHDPGKYAGREG